MEDSAITPRDIDRGLRELGLADDSVRLFLARLADLAPKRPALSYESVTAAHTAPDLSGVRNAELESDS